MGQAVSRTPAQDLGSPDVAASTTSGWSHLEPLGGKSQVTLLAFEAGGHPL